MCLSHTSTHEQIIWLILAVLSTAFGWIWDVFMDWSIGRPQWKLLRRNLMLRKWVYYVAMPVDLLLRCAWLFTVAPSPFDGDLYIIALAFSLAVVELLRRIGWNVLRLANEHTQNALQLKGLLLLLLLLLFVQLRVISH